MKLRACLSAVACAFATFGTNALAQEPAQQSAQPCTLHVWGAQRDFTNHRRLAGPFAFRGTWHADPGYALAAINIANPVQRAADLDEAALAALLPNPADATIVRHPGFAEIGHAKRTRAPLHRRDGGCSADLIVMDIYELGAPTRPMPLVAGLLAARPGWYVNYIYRQFDQRGRLVISEKDRVGVPLRIPSSDWPRDPRAALAAIDEAMDASLQRFAQRVERQRR